MSELRFDGRVAVVTGAGRGLGRSYALLLGARGAKVVVNDLGGSVDGRGADTAPANEVVKEIRAAGGEAVPSTESVTTAGGGQAIVQAALNHYGRIDILVHNAGISRPTPLKDVTPEEFESVVTVHQSGGFHVARPAFSWMCAAGYGRIVLTSSICGLYGCHRNVSYGVAKTGLIGLNNIIALEGAALGVKSNIILPAAMTRMAGDWDTSQYPPMTVDMVAPMVGWLSHESCMVSGEMYAAIAGRMARAFVSETPGVYREGWTMEEVARQIDAIRDTTAPLTFPVVPAGHDEHIRYSFEMGYLKHHNASKQN